MKNKLKTKFNGLSKGKKLAFGILGFFCFFMLSISAVWYSFHEAETGLIINSEDEISFTNNLDVTDLNVTLTEDYIKSEAIEILNTNGIQEFAYEINTTILDDEYDLCNNTADVVIEYIYDGEVLQENGLINITSGNSFLNVTTTAKAFSCPQNVTSEILISN